MTTLLPRGLQPTIERAWASAAVVVLDGLRATGKSTITRNLVTEDRFRSLNISAERARAVGDPDGWLAALPRGVVIDEAQLVPELQLSVKHLRAAPTHRSSCSPGRHGSTPASSAGPICSQGECGDCASIPSASRRSNDDPLTS
jgi:AAA domain